MATSEASWDAVRITHVGDSVEIYCPHGPTSPPRSFFERAPRAVLEARKVWLRHWGEDRASFQAWLGALLAHPPSGLTGLQLGSSTTTELGDVTPVFQALPRLESLLVEGRATLTAPFSAPAVEHLLFWSHGTSAETGAALLRGVLPRLRRLHLISDTNDVSPEVVVEFFRRTDLPCLRELRLDNLQGERGMLSALLQSPVAAQLEVLMLPSSRFPEEEAEAAAANKALLTRMTKVLLPDDTWHVELDQVPNVEFG